MTAKAQAKQIVSFYKRYVYSYGAGSAFMTGTEDEESQLELAKRCATYHVQGIQASEPTIPSGGDEDLSDAMIYAGGFWQDVESQIQSLELSDLIEEP